MVLPAIRGCARAIRGGRAARSATRPRPSLISEISVVSALSAMHAMKQMSEDPQLSRRRFLSGRVFAPLITSLTKSVPGNPGTSTTPEKSQTDGAPTGNPAGSALRQRHAVFPIIRPPHAVDETSFLKGCTRCEACIKACPHEAIVHAPARFRAAAGTPMIDPNVSPCRACSDTPCVSACEPNVLRLDAPFAMSNASIDKQSCMAHQGSFCTVCSEHCPVPGAITTEAGKPTIHASACTGCGVCQYVCPAPQKAILVIPIRSRPTPGELNNAIGASE